MSNATRATQALSRAGVAFTLHPYDYDPGSERVGLQAADALGVDPARLLKTLMLRAGRQAVCVVVPSDREVSLKALAAHLGVKTVEMMPPKDAERVTGYVVGGISPFGQRQPATTVVEADALAWDTVYINAGRRGLILSCAPGDAVRMLGAATAQISG